MKLEKNLREVLNKTLQKQEDPKSYAKIAENSLLLGHPVSINGKTKREDNGIHYHSTIKFSDKNTDKPEHIHPIASKLDLEAPDSKKVGIEPGKFKDRNNNDVYVLKLKGEHADKLKNLII